MQGTGEAGGMQSTSGSGGIQGAGSAGITEVMASESDLAFMRPAAEIKS